MIRRPPRSPLFPSTTLSRSVWPQRLDGVQPGDQVLVFADLPRDKPFAVHLSGAEPQQVVLGEAEQPLLERAWVNARIRRDRKSTRLNSSHLVISYAVFCLKK